MYPPIRSILQVGSAGIVIETECRLSNGLPAIIIVGLGNKAVDEAKERIRGAFVSAGVQLPRKRIAINLAPADIPKDSTSLDLPIAAAIIAASEKLAHQLGPREALIGELGLDGAVRPVRGIIGKILSGQAAGIDTFYIPEANLGQARLIPDVTIVPLKTFQQLYEGLAGKIPLQPVRGDIATPDLPASVQSFSHTPSMIAGQERAKRALLIAAAGSHNLFMNGAPGTGKSLLAKALPALLPPPSTREVLEITHLHSLASNTYDSLVTVRPFRSPHHSASPVSIVGGGHGLRPGEISLSHHGVLLLDEMPEFQRTTLEALRQPLEDGTITLARAKEVATYPANFILVGTANPCPCGYYGSAKICECSANAIMRYRQRISGPIMDRFDLYVVSEEIEHEKLLAAQRDPAQDHHLRQQVRRARERQSARYGFGKLNSDLASHEIVHTVQLSDAATSLLNQAASRLNVSARSYMRIIKVARTIADLDDADEISTSHMSEAIQYRAHTGTIS